jgi:predicted nucleic acid-binding protein
MSDKCFVDTNILVYAHDRSAGDKHNRAKDLIAELWHEKRGVISTQVLQEFYVNVRKKAVSPLSSLEVRRILQDYLCWEVVVNDGPSVLEAIAVEERHKVSFRDALIVQAANAAGVTLLYSEDLNTGQKYGNVTVENPFLLL